MRMNRRHRNLSQPSHWLAGIGCALSMLTFAGPAQSEQLTVACSASERLCSWLRNDENALRGIDLNIESMTASDVLRALRESPGDTDIDVWWGAPDDLLLKAAEENLLRAFEPANLHNQLRWSRQLWDTSNEQAVGLYAGTLAIITNPIALIPSNLPAPRCWTDLSDIQYRGQLILEAPETSDITFTFLSTLHRLFDTSQAKQLSEQIKLNAQNGSGADSLRRVAIGDRGITVALVHEAMLLYSFYSPLVVNMPCEGSGFVMDGAAISQATTVPGPASAFIEYTLSNEFQSAVVNTVSTQMFSNVGTAQSEVYRNHDFLNVINHDAASYYTGPYRDQVLDLWRD